MARRTVTITVEHDQWDDDTVDGDAQAFRNGEFTIDDIVCSVSDTPEVKVTVSFTDPDTGEKAVVTDAEWRAIDYSDYTAAYEKAFPLGH
jgi:hypothetical protein